MPLAGKSGFAGIVSGSPENSELGRWISPDGFHQMDFGHRVLTMEFVPSVMACTSESFFANMGQTGGWHLPKITTT
jgi:hypothetical protein